MTHKEVNFSNNNFKGRDKIVDLLQAFEDELL